MTLQQAFELAVAHHQAGRLGEAEQLYRQVLAVAPRHADALHLLGVIASQTGHHDAAVELIRQAVALAPAVAAYHSNLGLALGRRGDRAEAIAALRRALELDPASAEAHTNLGRELAGWGRFDEAVAAHHEAARLMPESAEIHNNLGTALVGQGRLDEAVAAFQRALQLAPGHADAHNNLGAAWCDAGLIAEAVAEYRRALELRPDFVKAHDNLLLALHCLPGTEPAEIFREHRRWNERHARTFASGIAPHDNNPDPARRLRVGYVSPDFREHSVASFFEPLLARHDRSAVEVFCYADLIRADAVTARLKDYAVTWREITGLSDDRVAELIRGDRIDLLVDLAGHTMRNRLLVFARRPAPVQLSYLGYCDTTGMDTIDYRLTDAHADPPGATEAFHSERLVRLPECAWCFSPRADAPPVSEPPCSRAGHVTFGSFSALAKMSGETIELWAEILRALPGARLCLKNLGLQHASAQQRTREAFARLGIAPERIDLLAATPTVPEHLAAHGALDVALDTFPYHGTTTTCEVLWMGVPVVTLAGRTHASRVGVSLLTNAGLPELIAGRRDDYVRLAVDLAADAARLAALRATLRERMTRSPLMGAPRFARNVEAAYGEMWREWCAKR